MFDKVKAVLSEYTNTETIAEASMLEADLGLSSFDVVSIVEDFEEVFGIEIPDRDIPKFVCVRDIMDYLKSQK
jgi:acyl carrier protein